jgi:hypothetical protein
MEDTPIPAQAEDSDRLRSVAVALAIPLGVFGAHRFYVGKIGTGLLQLCTVGGAGLWWLYDLILILLGEFRDSEGRRVSHWSRTDIVSGSLRDGGRMDGRALEELEAVQSEVRELAERLDFMERLLTQAREKERLTGERKP